MGYSFQDFICEHENLLDAMPINVYDFQTRVSNYKLKKQSRYYRVLTSRTNISQLIEQAGPLTKRLLLEEGQPLS